MSGKFLKCEAITLDITPNFPPSNKLNDDKIKYMKDRVQRNVLSVNSSLISRRNLTAKKKTEHIAKENRT
jgi:hypothetical protein